MSRLVMILIMMSMGLWASQTALAGKKASRSDVLDCMNLEEKLLGQQAVKTSVFPPALSKLRDYLAQPDLKDFAHELELTPTGVKLNVGSLQRDQKRFMNLVTRAIQEGSLTEIDAGSVVGPKVFIMLNHFMSSAPNRSAPLTVRGEFSRKIVASTREEYSHERILKHDPENPYGWTEAEIRHFEVAVKSLGLERCKGSQSCRFQITVRNGQGTVEILQGGPR
jgi:hypothetical protein